MKRPLLGLLLTISALLFSCATSKKSSEIPERRNFPTSTSAKACDNFFEYACGPAIDQFQLREDRSRHIFSFDDSAERLLHAKKDYLHSLTSMQSFNEKSQQLRDYYMSCMNKSARATEEKTLVQQALQDMNAIKTKKELALFLTQKSLKGSYSHVQFGNIENLDNSNVYDFLIMPNLMASMPDRSYYNNPELMKEFVGIVTEFFKITGLDNPAQRAQWVADFEKDMINNYPTPAERRSLWTKKAFATQAQLRNFKNLELQDILKKVPAKTKIRNPTNEVFVFMDKAFERYSLDQLKSAYLFQTVNDIMDEAYPDHFKRVFAFQFKFLGGSPERSPLDERCTQDVMAKFTKEIDSQLFSQFFPNFDEAKFIALLEKVRGSIIEGLEKNTWLSKTSKTNAIKKVKMAKFQVVKPKNDKEWDFNPIGKYSPEQYIQNSRQLSQLLNEREFKRLPLPVDKDKWYMGPLTVNAYYDPTANKFVMPAGILQYPFYDPSLPEWVNLGAVGAVVGHELGHGVDDQGSQYDEHGKVRQWMTKEDVNTFHKRGEKLIAQFEAAGHNGKLTLGENIGDLVGVTFALNAAKKIMPLDPIAREQATKNFFLQYARAWCGVMRPKMVEMRLKTDPHALVWARVNEQVKHQADFAQVYQCKDGDKMHLSESERVTIW